MGTLLTTDWRMSISRAIRSSAELRRYVGLPPEATPDAESDFPVFVPREYADRIRHGDPDDPLLRQVLADSREDVPVDGFGGDAVGDLAAMRPGGVVHKYDGRVLLMTSAACGVHCRYCFRREFPYAEHSDRGNRWDAALTTIGDDESIREVILSGGDPLTVDDPPLVELLKRLEAIEHVRRIRFHTRMPTVIPSRVTTGLCQAIERSTRTVVVVLHVNHFRELGGDVDRAINALRRTGAMMFNQSVLLRGVNDDVATLADLCEGLVDRGVTPYYLHSLDRAAGVAHFDAPRNRGVELIEQLRRRLPGYAVPRHVVELAGEPSKTPLG